jgi:outer membrane protein assembly factor BamA
VCVGNKVTYEKIILRELPFGPNDTISISDTNQVIQQAEQNLINTSLFHFATVMFQADGVVVIDLTERWYIWPSPFLAIEERNFNVWLRDMSLEKVTYGLYASHQNFRGRRETLKILFKSGYNQMYGFSYQNPYIDKKQNWGISVSAGFEGSHSITANIDNHEPQGFKLINSYAYSGFFTSFSITRRIGFYQTHNFKIAFDRTHFADSLLVAFSGFASGKLRCGLSFNYVVKQDRRDFKPYPLVGWYADLELNWYGAIPFAGNNNKLLYTKSHLRKYLKIKNRWYFATGGVVLGTIKNDATYLSTIFMGYDNDFCRGYGYQVIPARNFAIHRNNLKYNILKTRKIHLPLIKTSRFNTVPLAFFINTFFDQAWSEKGNFAEQNPLAGKYLAGWGIGIDMVTYYDKVFRLEFTMNRFHEKGIFLQFTAPI